MKLICNSTTPQEFREEIVTLVLHQAKQQRSHSINADGIKRAQQHEYAALALESLAESIKSIEIGGIRPAKPALTRIETKSYYAEPQGESWIVRHKTDGEVVCYRGSHPEAERAMETLETTETLIPVECNCRLNGDHYKAPEQHSFGCPWRTNHPYAIR